MNHDWTQIYLYIVGKTYTRWKKTEMPADIAVDSLRDDQVADSAQRVALSEENPGEARARASQEKGRAASTV